MQSCQVQVTRFKITLHPRFFHGSIHGFKRVAINDPPSGVSGDQQPGARGAEHDRIHRSIAGEPVEGLDFTLAHVKAGILGADALPCGQQDDEVGRECKQEQQDCQETKPACAHRPARTARSQQTYA
jgi:hypothetical protein